jgi:uncharacterized protein RhaS with RHS repeats
LPAAVLSPSAQFYFAPDHLGSPHQITDASGAAAWPWNHDPFGNGDPTGAFGYELRFPGSSSTRARNRDYDPRTGVISKAIRSGCRVGSTHMHM